jgi:hypothetical protein
LVCDLLERYFYEKEMEEDAQWIIQKNMMKK